MNSSMPPVHPAADLYPMMTAVELEKMAADIKANGLHYPVVLFGAKLLDGRNRWRACEMAGVSVKTRDWTGTEEEAISFVLSCNSERRHLGPAQKAAIAAEAVDLYEEAARKRMAAGGGDKRSPEAKSGSNDSLLPGKQDQTKKATAQAAKAAGAGVNATQTMKAVKTADKSVFDLAKQGKVTVADAKRLADLPEQQRQQSVALVKAGATVREALPRVDMPPVAKIAEAADKTKRAASALSNALEGLLALLRKHEASVSGAGAGVTRALLLSTRAMLDECIELIGEE